jgi:elongator complex protein 5
LSSGISGSRSAPAPARLIALLPHTSALLPHLLPLSLSSTVTCLHPHHPNLVTSLSRAYLTPIDSSPRFWQILDNARDRRIGETMAFRGEDGIDISGSWDAGTGAIVQILMRKATGGAKGMNRSLAGLQVVEGGDIEVCKVEHLIPLNPVSDPSSLGGGAQSVGVQGLDLPFNLSLTDEQKRRRGEVPLPYAHEGEGPSGDIAFDFEEEGDEDDEEI